LVAATITSKGRITIPAQVRASLGVAAGDRVEFVEQGKGQFAIMASTQSVQDLKGLIRKPAKPVSIEELNAAITSQGAAAK
jgi:AbrB family looped-hinge helix DNA binding protein